MWLAYVNASHLGIPPTASRAGFSLRCSSRSCIFPLRYRSRSHQALCSHGAMPEVLNPLEARNPGTMLKQSNCLTHQSACSGLFGCLLRAMPGGQGLRRQWSNCKTGGAQLVWLQPRFPKKNGLLPSQRRRREWYSCLLHCHSQEPYREPVYLLWDRPTLGRQEMSGVQQ